MVELIDIVDENGIPTGRISDKTEVHLKGYYHNTAHVWYYTANHEILLAQRAATKTICPLLWDVSVAGHVDAGEDIIDAAIRETKEEIGLALKPNQLQKIGVFKCFQSYSNGIEDNEFHNTFIVQLIVPTHKLNLNKQEVEEVKLVSFTQFQTLLDHSEENGHFIASNRDYYILVLESIKNALKI